jgi:hypothetical protein
MAQRAQRGPAGAHSLTGQGRSGPRWLPWLALLALVVIAVVAWMVIRDDDDAYPGSPAEWTSAHHVDPVHV